MQTQPPSLKAINLRREKKWSRAVGLVVINSYLKELNTRKTKKKTANESNQLNWPNEGRQKCQKPQTATGLFLAHRAVGSSLAKRSGLQWQRTRANQCGGPNAHLLLFRHDRGVFTSSFGRYDSHIFRVGALHYLQPKWRHFNRHHRPRGVSVSQVFRAVAIKSRRYGDPTMVTSPCSHVSWRKTHGNGRRSRWVKFLVKNLFFWDFNVLNPKSNGHCIYLVTITFWWGLP